MPYAGNGLRFDEDCVLDPTSNRFGCHALVKSPWRGCGTDGMRWPVLLYDYAPRVESQKTKEYHRTPGQSNLCVMLVSYGSY
jgi:hypothetical protein